MAAVWMRPIALGYQREEIEEAVRFFLEKFDGLNGFQLIYPGNSGWADIMLD
jgi:hypothetical protein